MPKVDVYNMQGKKVSDVELSEAVFGIEPNENIVHSALHKVLKQEQKLVVVEENHGDKKEQVEQDKVVYVHHNGLKVVLH